MLYIVSGLLKKTKHSHMYQSTKVSESFCVLHHYIFDQKSIYDANFTTVTAFVLFARLSTNFFYIRVLVLSLSNLWASK
jgi:hypothetical protein